MKVDALFSLENAGWPALVVDGLGRVHHANPLAGELFGSALKPEGSQLSEIWSAENPLNVNQFLTNWDLSPSPTFPIKLQSVGGAASSWLAAISAFAEAGQKYFLIQLLPENASAAPATKNQAPENGLLHKQKLDCALQMARTVSLDFNNALTGILGHTSLILNKIEPAHPWRGVLLEVEKSAARAAEIANDLGAFSRQEKESRALHPGNLNPLLQQCVKFFHQDPTPDPIKWSLQLERKLFAARFDELKMQQVFLRIFENAVQALRGNGRISIQTRNVELGETTQDLNVRLVPGAYVCVEINDNGCGIEPEVLPRIFEPFFTTKRGGNHRGLGLAWVYGILTNHGGGVAVSSQPGTGTSVRVYLPAEKTIVKDTGPDGPDLAGTQTVLFVDDEDSLLTMGQTILSAYGYRVLMANSGQKALDILGRNKEPIDVLLTDLVMPGMSGRELVEQVKGLWPAIRIICTSGYAWSAHQSNERAYLQKPFTTQELLRKLKQVLAAELA